MNASDDMSEPLGEAPEYVIITAPPREALTSIPVLGENERNAIAEIRQYATENASAKALREMCIGFHGKPISNFTVKGDDILAILDKWGV